MPNLELTPKKNLSPFRKIAIGTWHTAYDPSVYGSLTLRMEEALRYIEVFRQTTGKRITLSHMIAKAVAAALEDMPDANAILRYNRIYLRKRIGVFFQVVMEDPDTGEIDLSGAAIHDPESKSLEQIVDEFAEKVEKVRERKDKQLESTRGMFRRVPYFFLNRLLKIISFLSYTFNLDLRWMGVPNDPFGSVMITNIGSIGLDTAYVPLVPYSRVPIMLAMGAVREVPIAEDGELACGKVMDLCATFDHRVLDGMHAVIMAKTVRKWMENPFDHFDDLSSSASSAASSSPSSSSSSSSPSSSASPAAQKDRKSG